ncbi:MAG: SPOR domain-containing protein [Gemmatimonadota bacterium]
MTALIACDGSPSLYPEPLEGASLVAGTSIPRHGLLVVPRAGGVAELRATDDPSRVRWTGTVELPATQRAYSLGRSVVLHAEDGAVTVFQPSGEVIREVGRVPPEAKWIPGQTGGAFVWESSALVLTQEETRSITTTDRVAWAAFAAGGRVVLLTGAGSTARLEVWEAGAEEPSSIHPVVSQGPALLTGWGREVILPEGDDGRTLVERVLPDLEPTERTRLDRAPIILAASPSQHRLFTASAGNSRLESIDRYGWKTLGRTTLDGPVLDVRPAMTGGLVLAFDGARIWAVRAGETEPVQVGSDWRIDLPLGLPGPRVLGVVGGSVRVFDLEGGSPVDVDGSSDAWWLPVRWTPRRVEPVVRAPSLASEEEGVAEDTDARAQPLNVGLTTLGRVAGRAVPARGEAGIDFVGEASAERAGEGDPFTVIPEGFYAVATSSRQFQTLQALKVSLEGSGYATEVLTRRDEANELWYRLMVGPFRSRSEAEEAATRLQRERGISAWIHEAIGGPR